ncbi:hypothetical protein [Deinococcus sp.]|uniref:hypothetical protein n=1 Tax=Deinococcus sp. TaxID=47478 RepID=UPI003C7E996B
MPSGPAGDLAPALERQRRRRELGDVLETHAGALDIERLVSRLPDGQAEAGRALRRSLRQHGRYVRLGRPLGLAALTWKEQTGGWSPSRPGLVTRLPVTALSVTRLVPVLGWLERLSGVRFPAQPAGQEPTLAPGQVALLLPDPSGGLLLAERDGRLFQYLSTPTSTGRWNVLDSVAAFQTGEGAQVSEQALGLERAPLAWNTLSSARRGERARLVRGLILLVLGAMLALIFSFLTHGGLWLLIGPALILTLLLALSLERRFSVWVNQGAARRSPEAGRDSGPAARSAQALSPFTSPAQQERLLSPETRARLAALRSRLASQPEQALADPLLADLDGLLQDRLGYPHPDAALDALLEGQMEALSTRLEARLTLERQRARELAAERLRREPVDPHF